MRKAAQALTEWVTVQEASRITGAAETTVRVAIQEGRIRGQKIGRQYLALRTDVERWTPGPQGPKRRPQVKEEGS